MGLQSQSKGQEPFVIFNEKKPESYWDEFFTDIFIYILPVLTILAGLIFFKLSNDVLYLKSGVVMLGFASLMRTVFSYNTSHFPEISISSLLKKVKVSKVRGVPCRLKGKIIGRGVPGLIWSEDFVLQDDTGIMYLDYQQPLAIWNFLFGLLGGKNYIGNKVEIVGWYRRAPIPYVELKSIKLEKGRIKNCYVFYAKIVISIIIVLIGLFLILFK